MVVVSLALTDILLIRKRSSVSGAIALGLTVFIGLLVLDAAVVIRYLGITPYFSGYNLTLDFSRLFRETGQRHIESIANLAAFFPFGFFLAEFLATLKRIGIGRQLGFAALTAFSLSLCIECLQLVLKVGYFEVMDLVLNTLGGFVGAVMAIAERALLARGKR